MQDLGPILKQTVLSGGTAEITVTGHSMLPLLLDRVSRVRLTALTEPKRGDIVLYRRDNGVYVLHRIMDCEADGTYTMCGDNQYMPEHRIRKEQLIARVTDFARREKWRSCDDIPYRIWWHLHLFDRPFRRYGAALLHSLHLK